VHERGHASPQIVEVSRSRLTDQSHVTSNHSYPALSSGRLTTPDFVMKCIEVRAVRCPEVLEVHTGLLHYCTLRLEAANDAQNVRVDRAHGEDNNQGNLSIMIM